jgi:hypothetical protein
MQSSVFRTPGGPLGAFALSAAVSLGVLAGCRSFGAGRVPGDRFDYNQSIARSTNEQMLLNVVRLRYSEPPVFLALNSVLTQYIYSGSVGINGSSGATGGDPNWSAGGSADLLYIERPTITYTPLSGQEFAAQLIAPVPPELVFGLVESGWPPEHLLLMMVQRINNLQNVSFVPATPIEEEGKAKAFHEVVRLLVELARREAIEMETGEDKARYLVFRENPDAATQALTDQLKDAIGLARDRSRFRVTSRKIQRGPDEVTVRVRSMLELMGFLARGVQIPPEHLEQDRAVRLAGADQALTAAAGPLRVASQEDPPEDAFVAIRHQGYWFFIRATDHQSKQAFGLLTNLFQMQAPQIQGAGPLLTVPTG